MRSCVTEGHDILSIDRTTFPLPSVANLMAKARREALWGCGVSLIRGLPVEWWSRREAAIAFWGLGQYLGEPVSQNGDGHVLGHVADLGLDYAAPTTRGYQTSAPLPFHTDYSDLVALGCLRTAKQGGLSSLASSARIYHEMQRDRPDLVAALRQPICRTRWGEVSSGQKPWLEVPVFNVHDGGVSTTYVRSAIRKAQALEGVPRLTALQTEALDHFDRLAADSAFHVMMAFKPGDIQIVNNHCIVHSRTEYIDDDEPSRRRHLLRLWLSCEDGPPFPQGMTKAFQGLTRNGRPNGIHIEGVPFVAPLEA